MIEISYRDFEKKVLDCELPVFVCFTTEWCHSCFPTCLLADQLGREYDDRVKFVRLDKEKSPEIAEKYCIIAVPTILIFRNTQELHRFIGFPDRSDLRSTLDSLVAESELPHRQKEKE